MKKLLSAILFAAAFLAFFQPVLAQNYQPFRKGLTYHFIAQDSIYSLRVNSVKVVGGDSVFVFNPIARNGGTPTGQPCSGGQQPRFAVHSNNQFGSEMQKSGNGEYRFKTAQGNEFLLKTKVAVGQSWPVNATSGITATLTSKTIENFSTVSDSMLTINLSNGKTIKLSKNYGLVFSPNFIAYSDAYFRPKDLTFYALPEKGLGQLISSPFAVFDFQPGDRFYYHQENKEGVMGMLGVCSEEWTWREVLSRRNSPNGDSIYYSIKEEKLHKGYGTPGAPLGFCSTPTATTVHPSRTYQLVVTKNYEPAANALSQGFYAPLMKNRYEGFVSDGIHKTQKYNNRWQHSFIELPYDSCQNAFTFLVDVSRTRKYTDGLGTTFMDGSGINTYFIFELIAYVKGTETFGTWKSMGQLLATQKSLEPAAIKAYPNPFTSEVSLQFSSSFSTGKATVLVSNVLGQEVLKQEITVAPGQENRLEMIGLPKGIYVLKAEQHGKTYITRLVKE